MTPPASSDPSQCQLVALWIATLAYDVVATGVGLVCVAAVLALCAIALCFRPRNFAPI